MTKLFLHSMDPEQAWDYAVIISQTAFASVVKEVVSAIIPKITEDEERMDIRQIMLFWVCKSFSLLQSDATPPPEITAYDGVPVALLPFVFGCDRSRTSDKTAQERPVYVQALWLRKEFMQLLDFLRSCPSDARLDQIDFGDAGARFMDWCRSFCKVYVHYLCNPLIPTTIAMLERQIPRLYEGYLKRDEADVIGFLKLKAMYYGLVGRSYSWGRLATEYHARLMARQEAASQMEALLQAAGPMQ